MEARRRKEEEERRKQEEADKKLAVSVDNLKEHLPVLHLETNCSLSPNSFVWNAVECRTRNRESPGSNPPFATVSKCGDFCSLHDAPVHSAV